MRPFYTLLFILTCCIFPLAQETHDILPRGFAQGEEALIPAYNAWRNSRTVACEVNPPTAPARSMAEWEELQAIAITWTGFPSILSQIVAEAIEECHVVIICSNQAVVMNQLGGAGITDFSNITFLEDEYDSIWIRDYGPNTVYLNEVETLAFVDWIYNRPRPDDDIVPEVIADALGIPIYCTTNAPTDLVHTGGNFMADGLGTGFSSELILEENDATNQWGTSNHSEEDIDLIMDDYMGISIYPKMTVLPYDLIHHIDMHMKLLDETTLLVGEYPTGIADGPQIEANIQFVLDNYVTPYGTPYNVIRIPMPPENGQFPNSNGDYRTYTNAVFVNKTILVPTYEEQYDIEALAIWEEAMPGYEIVGIDCNDIIPLSGAIHCITKEIGVDEPLLITHNRLMDQDDTVAEYPVEASIKHKDGISYAIMYYKTDLTAAYNAASMTDMGNDNWSANIPGQPAGTTIYYYFQAEANDGKQQARPIVAPDGHFSFEVTGSVAVDDLTLGNIQLQPVFPNPASAITCIPVNSPGTIEASVTLKDVFGRTVGTLFQGGLPKGDSKYFFDASQLPAGTYFVELQTDLGSISQTVVVK